MNRCKTCRLAVCLFSIYLVLTGSIAAQNSPTEDKVVLREKASALVKQNRYLDAHPLLEKLAPLYPDDAEVWAEYGIAILSRSATLTSEEERKTERIKGYNVLAKAKALGTNNVMALYFLDQLPPDGGDKDNFGGNPEFEKNLREGEAFFGHGEYEKAFAAYEKAFKINPKSYEAVLFMGDSRYAAGKYIESEPWFAKAVEIDPNHEQAYRFWGDALMNQKKTAEARDKFVDALIADPYSRMTWDRLGRWAEETSAKIYPVSVVPPGNDIAGDIVIDDALLKSDDGTVLWKLYSDTRKSQVIASGGGARTLAGDVAAFRKVADAVRSDLKAGKIKYPDKSLTNLVKLDDSGLLEAYVLLVRANEDIMEEYSAYREKNRDKIRKLIVEFLLGLPS